MGQLNPRIEIGTRAQQGADAALMRALWRLSAAYGSWCRVGQAGSNYTSRLAEMLLVVDDVVEAFADYQNAQ